MYETPLLAVLATDAMTNDDDGEMRNRKDAVYVHVEISTYVQTWTVL